MRKRLFGHGYGSFSSSAWKLVVAVVLGLICVSSGCDPAPPPDEDLGTVLPFPPVIAGAEDGYQLPEAVARQAEQAEVDKGPSGMAPE